MCDGGGMVSNRCSVVQSLYVGQTSGGLCPFEIDERSSSFVSKFGRRKASSSGFGIAYRIWIPSARVEAPATDRPLNVGAVVHIEFPTGVRPKAPSKDTPWDGASNHMRPCASELIEGLRR